MGFSIPCRSTYKKWLVQVSELDDLSDKLRMKAKVEVELAVTAKECKSKVQALKGDDGVKDKYMDFIEEIDEKLTSLTKQSKEQVVINIVITFMEPYFL